MNNKISHIARIITEDPDIFVEATDEEILARIAARKKREKEEEEQREFEEMQRLEKEQFELDNPPIASFKGEYAFLSNFYPSPLVADGITYPTVEHAFQAAKTNDPQTKSIIAAKDTPGKAKRAGGRRGIIKDFDPNWETRKISVMSSLVRQKFQDPELRELLNNTGERELIEGNSWNDTFWGVCRGKGKNNLGKILMQIRADLNPAHNHPLP